METSILIARIFAVVYIMVGLGMFMSPTYYQRAMKEMLESTGVVYLGGAMAVVVGLLIVMFHNVWTGWATVITVFGWASLIKGFMFLVFPGHLTFWKFMAKKEGMMPVWGAIVLLLGVFFGYYGFVA